MQQAPWGGLLHLPQSLHGENLNDVNDHTRNLKHGKTGVNSSATLTPRVFYVLFLSLYLIHEHFQGDGDVVNEVIH